MKPLKGSPTAAVVELRNEHEALAALAQDLSESELEIPSFASEWTVAQVFSHLGSGGEINSSNLRGALGIEPRIPHDSYKQLWARWDALPPRRQVDEFRRWHAELVERFEQILESSHPDRDVETVMGTMSAAQLAEIRLREAAIHRWDIAVVLDPDSELRADSVRVLLNQLPGMMQRLADDEAADASPIDSVGLRATDHDMQYELQFLEEPTLREVGDGAPSAMLELTSETLIRLFYGRLRERDEAGIAERPPGLLLELRKIYKGL
jgi:uncharacterized protein (TIGR03083 family)